MAGIFRSSVFFLCLSLFVVPVPTHTDLLVPGDPTRPAIAQIPLLPEYFSVSAVPQVPALLTTFATSSGLPAQPLTPPPLPEACDACPDVVAPPILWEAEEVFMPPAVTAPVLPEPPDAGRLWLQAELAGIFDPDPWQTYLTIERSIAERGTMTPRDKKAARQVLNDFYVKQEKGVERMKIREKWTETFGVDIWYPYFKVKEVERWVKQRFSFRIRKLKCKPRIKKGLVNYICEKRF